MQTKVYSTDFANLVRALSLVKEETIDVQINAGIFRQLTRDKTAVFEMDMREIIPNCDIVLSYLKIHLPLLRALSTKEVQITTTENAISFSSERSTFAYILPRLDYLDNRFMTTVELNNLFPLKEEDLILRYLITDDIANLMRLTAAQFNTISFQISFEDEKASILAYSDAKDKHATLDYEISLTRPLRGLTDIQAVPFLIDHDRDILLKIYNVEGNLCCAKFQTSVGKIPVNVYCRCRLMREGERKNSSPLKEGGVKPGDGMDKEMGVLTEEGQGEKSGEAN